MPLTTRLYILQDSKREATRLGLPFEQGVFTHGLDAGDTRNLMAFAKDSGFATPATRAALQDNSWQDITQADRAEMLSRGLRGFKGDFSVQDTLAHALFLLANRGIRDFCYFF